MKKLFGMLLAAGFLLINSLPVAAKVERVGQEMELEGEYELVLTMDEIAYEHQLVIGSFDSETGEFTGHGWYTVDPDVTWDVIGSLVDGMVGMTIVYTNINPGYEVFFEGELQEDGMIEGTAVSSADQEFTWELATDLTLPFVGNHGQWMKMHVGVEKKTAAKSRIGMPIQSLGHL